MRKLLIFTACALVFSACLRNTGSHGNSDRTEERSRKEILKIAEKYASDNLSDAKKNVNENGIIILSDASKAYVIDPSKIFLGPIDRDTVNDAIVTLYPFRGNYEVTSEHLVIIYTDGKPMLIRTIESDMRIISIEDGIITAEVPEHSRNSPLFDCPSCREVVKYRFINGELVKED